jgi:3-oxoadipate enol-lactonase
MTETITMGDGTHIAYRLDGPEDAPVLLLSNSLGTNMQMWAPQIAAWSVDFRVLRYDQRGHGASDGPVGAYSLDRLGRDVIELLDALSIQTVDFCGLSLGGMTGQWLGIHASERIRTLVLANTAAYMGPPANWDARINLVRTEGITPLVEASISRWFTPSFQETHAAEIEPITAMLQTTNPVGYMGCCAAIRDMDLRKTAHLIPVRTYIIGGALDPATPPQRSVELKESIVGSSLKMLEAAHLSNVERQTEFAAEVRDFVLA